MQISTARYEVCLHMLGGRRRWWIISTYLMGRGCRHLQLLLYPHCRCCGGRPGMNYHLCQEYTLQQRSNSSKADVSSSARHLPGEHVETVWLLSDADPWNFCPAHYCFKDDCYTQFQYTKQYSSASQPVAHGLRPAGKAKHHSCQSSNVMQGDQSAVEPRHDGNSPSQSVAAPASSFWVVNP